MNKILIVIFVSALFTSCANEEINPRSECVQGEVIGKIRSAGGGIAVALSQPVEGSVTWQGRNNVVEVLNVPVEFTFSGTSIYFQSRDAKEGERGPISSDGDETIERILYGSNFSNVGCEETTR